jgi:hypothetical protein
VGWQTTSDLLEGWGRLCVVTESGSRTCYKGVLLRMLYRSPRCLYAHQHEQAVRVSRHGRRARHDTRRATNVGYHPDALLPAGVVSRSLQYCHQARRSMSRGASSSHAKWSHCCRVAASSSNRCSRPKRAEARYIETSFGTVEPCNS